MRDFLRRIRHEYLPALLPVVLILVAWEIAGGLGYLPKFVAPVPSLVLRNIIEEYSALWEYSLMSLEEVFYGYVIGIILGFSIGLAVTYSPSLERALYPVIVASQTVPFIAFAPVLVAWFGFGIASKVWLVAQVTFFPIVIATVDGMRSIDPELLLFTRTLSASEWQVLRKIRLPAFLPYFFTGVRVSAPYAMSAAIVAEWIGANRGLGALMIRAQHELKTDMMFATVVVMSVVAMLMFLVATVLMPVFAPWHQAKLKRGQ
jgi:ABC-type nitrate/sulfonate/bicarbonate transport system permease component